MTSSPLGWYGRKKFGRLAYLPDKVIREIYQPEKQFERTRYTKAYMQDFFKRNLTRPN